MNTVKYGQSEITPSKVICIGRNYVDHIKELNNETPDNMVIFNKPNSSVSNELKYFSEDTRYEGEISFLIKNNKIDAVAFGLDLTKANQQNALKKQSLPWERAKSFDGAAVFGEFVKLTDDISKIRLEMYINDELIQFGSYDLMMYKPEKMLSEIQSFMTFEDGDIIMSGTPKGVGTYKKNDKFTGKIFIEDTLLVSTTWIVS